MFHQINNSNINLNKQYDISSTSEPPELSNYPIIQINGRRVFGPPANWVGLPPSGEAELYIKQLPKTMMENKIIPLFERFGTIYEFRLMMDYNNLNRGYAYIRFATETEAMRAVEVMNHYFVGNKKTLQIKQSYNKCRLFAGNLPKDIGKEEIEKQFRSFFPEIESILMFQSTADANNRGYAFLNFPNHKSALLVKQRCAPGVIRMWNKDIKIVWANPEKTSDIESLPHIKTLFIKNIEMSVLPSELTKEITKFVADTSIKSVCRSRELAFVEFHDRQSAEIIKAKMQGLLLNGHQIEIQWAIPSFRDSIYSHTNTDYDASFRLKCIANYYDPPVTIYGRIFESNFEQVVVLMLRNASTMICLFFEIMTSSMHNIQNRIYESVINIISDIGEFPRHNYIIYINDLDMSIIGHVPDIFNPFPVIASRLDNVYTVHWEEMLELCYAVQSLSQLNIHQLKYLCEDALNKRQAYNFIESMPMCNRIIGCINSISVSSVLKNDLDSTHIILVLCDTYSKTNYVFPFKNEMSTKFVNFHSKEMIGNNISFRAFRLISNEVLYKNLNINISQGGMFFGKLDPLLLSYTDLLLPSYQSWPWYSLLCQSNEISETLL